MMTEHTSTPWEIREDLNIFSGNRLIANCGGHSTYPKSSNEENLANTNLIVERVNAHDGLVAALESALQTVEFENHPFRPWHSLAKDAIAQAKGKEAT